MVGLSVRRGWWRSPAPRRRATGTRRSAAPTLGGASPPRGRRSRRRAGRSPPARGPRPRPGRRARGSRRATPRRRPGRRSSRGTGASARSARHDRADREVRLPGHHVHDRGGKHQVELALRHLTVGIRPVAPGRPELAREPAAGLEPVGVRRDVEHLRQAGVGDGAVVALEEVLHADLPVARVLVRVGAGWKRSASTSIPPRARCSGSPPRWAASGSASVSGLTKTNGPHASTETGTRPSAVVSNPGSRSARGAFLSDPSRPYVHAW